MGLESAFERKAEKALLDEAEHELIGKRGNLVHQTVQQAHEILRDYGQEYDYDVEPIIDSFVLDEVDRSGGSITVRWGWEHEASIYMAYGTSDHTVEGDPLLVFEFDAAEYPGLAEMFPGGTAFLPETEVSGLAESRYARAALDWLRREVGE